MGRRRRFCDLHVIITVSLCLLLGRMVSKPDRFVSQRSPMKSFLNLESALTCTNVENWATKSCLCRYCVLEGSNLFIRCHSLPVKVRESLPQHVAIEVGGTRSNVLTIRVQCLNTKTFDATSLVHGNSLLLGRTGPWGLLPPFAGLHARSIYENVIPLLHIHRLLFHDVDVRDTTLFIISRDRDINSNEAMLSYMPFLKNTPKYLNADPSPKLFESLAFGIGGRGFLTSVRYESSLRRRPKRIFNDAFWLKKLNSSLYEHSGLLIPVTDFYAQFCTYELYRRLMFGQLNIVNRRVKTYRNVLIIDRAGQQRNWPFPVASLRRAILQQVPDVSVISYDYAGKSLAEQVSVSSWADVFISMHGSNVINRIFLQNEALSIIFYPNSGCYHQSDHVDRLVYWSHYYNFTFTSDMNMRTAIEDRMCGKYGQKCCQHVTTVKAEDVAALVLSKMRQDHHCYGTYCCTFGENVNECVRAAKKFVHCETEQVDVSHPSKHTRI